MALDHQLIVGDVMHARLKPKKNRFQYGIYYTAINLSHTDDMAMAHNRFSGISFHDQDHGDPTAASLTDWAHNLLNQHGLSGIDGEIFLVTLPRVLGYVFNPVSFWLCHDQQGSCRAIICEVNNTFGERHSYICAHADQRPITRFESLEGDKVFHVSPMLSRDGHYRFRFDLSDDRFAVWIDHFDADGDKTLVTWLIGDRLPMTKPAVRKLFWTHPLVTLKAILLIHWQALKLLTKGVKYISKPSQHGRRVSTTWSRFDSQLDSVSSKEP